MRRTFVAVILACAAYAGPTLAASDSPTGTWLTEERDSKIRVAPCGKAICATIVWAKQAGLDANNPDPSQRGRTILGLDLSRDMRPDGSGGWAGSIYNPENGKTYQATMKRRGEGELEVGGCVLGGLLCGSETWVKTAEPAPAATGSLSPKR